MAAEGKLAGPDLGPTGPSVEDEEQVLHSLYGEPDADGVYRGLPDEPDEENAEDGE